MLDKWKLLSWYLVVLLLSGLTVWSVPSARELSREQGQSSFASPEAAVTAMIAAVKQGDLEKLLAIFGAGEAELISSGDPVADHNGRVRFLKAYSEKNSLVKVGEHQMVLQVGSGAYPFPIPLVEGEKGWFFDTPAGKEEIVNRRIGRNELQVIEVLQAYTAAQRDYACRIRQDGEPAQFARNLVSSAGKRDGLYWPAGEDEEESPFGPLIAQATEAGYPEGPASGEGVPFHGYFFKILTAQGEHAAGGAFDYLVNRKMVLGFGLLAYPASYGSTGVKTFMVNQEGVIYEKDLGAQTAAAAKITTYDPDESWAKMVEPPE